MKNEPHNMTAGTLSKRLTVMDRSKSLGHCVCDPKRACPCSDLVEQDICPCAGERFPSDKGREVKLTELARNLGCASKIPATDLEKCLSRLRQVDDPGVISGLSDADDAGIYKIDGQTTLVQTVDVFTPCVDDPYIFGKICAANCLSDIYAMGGVPRTALSILSFPSDKYDGEIMYQMMRGAIEVLNSAGCTLLGGHSIKEDEVKLGFAVTGTIDPGKAFLLDGARAGDKLVLTKPLGVGILNFARQIGRAAKEWLLEAERSMMELNRSAAEAMSEAGVSAATDITGFGLFGHLVRMTRHSGVKARVYASVLPVFPGVLELLRSGVIPGAVERNAEFVGEEITVGKDVG
ncbi:MAG: selenide, water dikinase SelD, partial [Candidatus Omnitrophica bacterium]|nr:selenide, water dikinase SelD [Candidatus Omnitrophota bacterium]